ncbi:MAG: hypothetical protein IKS87_08615, partial [Lachnospiraceae bacterium]|nr:hypothetical protein [Lachnospiraceae bacterium]
VMSTGKRSDQISASDEEPTKAQASYQAGKEQARLQKKLEKLEASIETAEARVQELKDQLMDPALASDYVKLQELQDEIDAGEEEILTLMDEYDKVSAL